MEIQGVIGFCVASFICLITWYEQKVKKTPQNSTFFKLNIVLNLLGL